MNLRRHAPARVARGRARRGGYDRDQAELAQAALAVRLLRDPSGRPVPTRHLLAVQRTAGNRALARALARMPPRADETVSGSTRQSLSTRVRIPWGDAQSKADGAYRPSSVGLATADGASGGREAVIEHPEPGTVVMNVPDSIASSLAYKSAFSCGNPKLGPDEFGLTSWAATVVGPAVTADAASHAFIVTATIDCTIGWEVHSRGKVDVPDGTPPPISRGSWATAASDLMPDLSDDNGRPPRTEFWAKDLTERHEKYHASDMVKYGKAAFELAGKWLEGKAAATDADALALVRKVPDQMAGTMRASFLPRAEHRAYGDGAPDYYSRSLAITAHGKAGGYRPRRP